MTFSLYPPQQAAVDRALSACGRPCRWINTSETGCGKSPMAIAMLRALGARRILIVTPASVRLAWVEQFAKWWPERYPSVGVIALGSEAKSGTKKALAARDWALQCPVQIVSYELSGSAVGPYNAIVFDESHYLQSARAKWSQRAERLLAENKSAHWLHLTATLAPNEPRQAHNQLRLFWPRWGKPSGSGDPNFQFLRRYCLATPSEYAASGFTYGGVNPDTAAELAEEIAKVSTRLTRYDLREYLPRCDVHPLEIDWYDKRTDAQIASAWLDGMVREVSHCGVFCFHIEAANALALELRKTHKNVFVVTGEEDSAARKKVLDSIRELPNAILVASMKSVYIGISLTWIHRFLCLDWFTSPGMLTQFLGRFERLDSMVPSYGNFVVRKGTEQENQALRVTNKIRAINQLTKAGVAEKQIEDLFDRPMTDDEFAAETALLMATQVDGSLLDEDDVF